MVRAKDTSASVKMPAGRTTGASDRGVDGVIARATRVWVISSTRATGAGVIARATEAGITTRAIATKGMALTHHGTARDGIGQPAVLGLMKSDPMTAAIGGTI